MTEFNNKITPSFIRFKAVTTVTDSDSLFLQPIDSEIPNRIAMLKFKNYLEDEDNGILFGGTGTDEDVYKVIGGVGTSINSDIYNL
jgi:hypothetical protein